MKRVHLYRSYDRHNHCSWWFRLDIWRVVVNIEWHWPDICYSSENRIKCKYSVIGG